MHSLQKATIVILTLLLVLGIGYTSLAKEKFVPIYQAEEGVTPQYPIPKEFHEAPMLAEKVRKGELPPVEERLPEEPFVVGPGSLINEKDLPNWEVGQYGGVFKSVTTLPDIDIDIHQANEVEYFVNTPKFTLYEPIGGLMKAVEINEDNTVFTFTMRKGLKWSDGHPVTMEDIVFAFEDVIMNDKITPVFPMWLRSGGRPDGEPVKLEVIDDYTFRYIFAQPYGHFLTSIGVSSRWGSYHSLLKPAHYLKQFHIKYTPMEKLKPLLEQEGLSNEWWRLFTSKDMWNTTSRQAIGMPRLTPWIRVKSPEGTIVMERNPYYYKVDVAGNQLPYVDRWESQIVSDTEMLKMKIVTGEVNFCRIPVVLNDVPLYLENPKPDIYKVDLNLKMHNGPIALFLNLTSEDPVWRQVVNDVRFRRALNYAINRPEIIDEIFLGMGRPPKWIPGEFDPEKANQLLDEMGLNKRDAEGYRLGPDGQTFVLPLEVNGAYPDWVAIAQLLVQYFTDVGIKTTMKTIHQDLWVTRRDANELKITFDWIDAVNWPHIHQDFLPGDRARWGLLWDRWYDTSGADGEEPPGWVKELFEIYEGILSTRPGDEKRDQLAERLMEIYHEQVPIFILTTGVTNPIVIPPNLGNWPQSGLGVAAQFSAEQLFFKK